MTLPAPAVPGMRLEEVDTPALIVDLDRLDANIVRMAALAAGRVALRPHAKTHKCWAIGQRQVAAGAVGLCCQKVSEAELLVTAGARDVLVANEVVAPAKLRRLMALAGRARIALCCDSPAGAALAETAAAEARQALDIVIEIDVGAGRAGVSPGAPLLALARQVAAAPHLKLRGIQAYHGPSQHIAALDERIAVARTVAARAAEARDLLLDAGLPCEVVTGGGTGTAPFLLDSGVFTELQPGSYVFMDTDYARLEGSAEAGFQQSLFVLTALVSAAASHAMADAGHKSVAVDAGMPGVAGRVPYTYRKSADEAGLIAWEPGTPRLAVGDRLLLIPSHCDPTVNLHDWIVAIRDDRVEALWPVEARGASS